MRWTFVLINDVELVAPITPTRRFAATSPLKGEVGASTINITRRRAHAGFGNGG